MTNPTGPDDPGAQDECATFRASLQGVMQSLHALHHVMKVAGLLPDDQPQQATGRHDADAIERIAGALDIPPALLTGPSPDGLPDHWGDAAPTTHCPDCGHPWGYSATGNCCMPVKPGTNTPAATPNEPTTRCGCTTTPPATHTQTGLQSHPERANPPA